MSFWPGRASPNAFNFLRIYNKATDSAVYAYEHPAIEARLAALDTVVEPAARGRLLRQWLLAPLTDILRGVLTRALVA